MGANTTLRDCLVYSDRRIEVDARAQEVRSNHLAQGNAGFAQRSSTAAHRLQHRRCCRTIAAGVASKDTHPGEAKADDVRLLQCSRFVRRRN